MIKTSPPRHYKAKRIVHAIITSGKYFNFITPFPESNYHIATFGSCPFTVIDKCLSGVLLFFEGGPREFMFYDDIVDTSK